MKSAAEETTNVLEDTYSKASKGTTEYNLKLIEAARHNTNAAFDFATELMSGQIGVRHGRAFDRPCAQAIRGGDAPRPRN